MKQKKEDAVSPVIGIMLMLVVTIIIAAVVTGFVMDLSKDTNKTPTALFDAQYENGEFTLKHKGGDPIRLQDIQIVFEQEGGQNNNNIIYTRSGANGDLELQNKNSVNAAVSTADIIKVKNFPDIEDETTAIWTLTYIPTESLIANGKIFIQ